MRIFHRPAAALKRYPVLCHASATTQRRARSRGSWASAAAGSGLRWSAYLRRHCATNISSTPDSADVIGMATASVYSTRANFRGGMDRTRHVMHVQLVQLVAMSTDTYERLGDCHTYQIYNSYLLSSIFCTPTQMLCSNCAART